VFECVNYIYSQAANHLARGHFEADMADRPHTTELLRDVFQNQHQ